VDRLRPRVAARVAELDRSSRQFGAASAASTTGDCGSRPPAFVRPHPDAVDAKIQQQQLEHQRSQLLSETRGIFFALAVSVAVIIAGIAPLVEASADDRRLILLWTALVCVLAGLGYAAVRSFQARASE
jgi:hypothetical protein